MVTQVETSTLHSIRSAARHCGVAPNTVRNWVLTGLLPAERSNNRVYIKQVDLERAHAKRKESRTAAATTA